MMRWLRMGLVLCAFMILPLWLAAMAFDQLNRNQITYRYIADALDPLTLTRVNLTWSQPDQPLARLVTEADQFRIGQAVSEAWQAMSASQVSGDAEILKDRFSGIALARAEAATLDASLHGGRISVLDQTAKPIFFHKDGSLIQIEVEMTVARFIVDPDGLTHHQIDRDTMTVTLVSHTSGWRIFSLERTASAPLTIDLEPGPYPSLLGVNYYPADTPWTAFWANFDASVIREDFDRIQNLNGNSVRIFLPYQEFSAPATGNEALENLKALLAFADERNMKVVPTLFDLKPNFGPGNWANDIHYLNQVLPILMQSSAVAFVDLKNEADLDFSAHGRGQIEGWLRSMRVMAEQIAPNLAFTVGWSEAGYASLMPDMLDVVSYHEFGDQGSVRRNLVEAQKAAGDRPVFVTEIGKSSFNAALGLPGSPEKQANYLAHRLDSTEDAQGVFVWTLYDFSEVDTAVIGGTPWRKWLQGEYGLFRPDGSEKPSARVVRNHYRNADKP